VAEERAPERGGRRGGLARIAFTHRQDGRGGECGLHQELPSVEGHVVLPSILHLA
jgi:hypothetical protein